MFIDRIVGLTVIFSLCVFGHVLCFESSEEVVESTNEHSYVGVWYLLAVANSQPKVGNFSCGWFNVTQQNEDDYLFIKFKIIGNEKLHETEDRVKIYGSKVHYKIPYNGMNNLVLNMKEYNDNADIILTYNSTNKQFAELISRNLKASSDAKLAFGSHCKEEKLFITKINHTECLYN